MEWAARADMYRSCRVTGNADWYYHLLLAVCSQIIYILHDFQDITTLHDRLRLTPSFLHDSYLKLEMLACVLPWVTYSCDVDVLEMILLHNTTLYAVGLCLSITSWYWLKNG